MRENLLQQSLPGGRQDHLISPPVAGSVAALDQAARFQPVHQAGDIGPMGDQLPAQFNLREPLRLIAQQVQDIELAGAEVPPGKEKPTAIPQGFRRAQQLERSLIPRTGRLPNRLHELNIQVDCLYVNNLRADGARLGIATEASPGSNVQ